MMVLGNAGPLLGWADTLYVQVYAGHAQRSQDREACNFHWWSRALPGYSPASVCKTRHQFEWCTEPLQVPTGPASSSMVLFWAVALWFHRAACVVPSTWLLPVSLPTVLGPVALTRPTLLALRDLCKVNVHSVGVKMWPPCPWVAVMLCF